MRVNISTPSIFQPNLSSPIWINQLIYNAGKGNWDMRFFPTSENTFLTIRQAGDRGEGIYPSK